MTQYFDAVVTEAMVPVFNGTTDEVVAWLTGSARRYTETYQVCRGKDMKLFEIDEYLEEVKFRAVLELVREAIDEGSCGSLRVFEIDDEISKMINPIGFGEPGSREKYFELYGKVDSLIGEAIVVKDPNAHACEIARKIVDLSR